MKTLAMAILLGGCVNDIGECEGVTEAHVHAGYADAEESYAREVGFNIPECRTLRPAEWALVTEGDFPAHCTQRSDDIRGCAALNTVTGRFHLWLLECMYAPEETVSHERLHTILHCETGDVDTDHMHASWGKVAPL